MRGGACCTYVVVGSGQVWSGEEGETKGIDVLLSAANEEKEKRVDRFTLWTFQGRSGDPFDGNGRTVPRLQTYRPYLAFTPLSTPALPSGRREQVVLLAVAIQL
jgi:hypothetical protein